MAYQKPFDQYQPHDPPTMKSRDRNYPDRQFVWQNPTPTSFSSAPPSWANVQEDGRHPQYQSVKPLMKYPVLQKQAYDEDAKIEDVFSGMQVWEAPSTKNRRQHQQYAFHQPPATAPKQDVFANIGKWDSNITTPQKPAPTFAPMSLNTLTPYGKRAPSLESPTTSLESSPEEKNSWTSFELLLNPKSSRSSDSGSEYSTPIDPHGHWNSNLQHY